MNEDFTIDGLWTPQTYMLQSIRRWVVSSDSIVKYALSIDSNPILSDIFLERWPGLLIQELKYPEFDAMDLKSIKSNYYDLVFSHQVLEHIPKPWLAAKEIIRVLRPGGIGVHTTCTFNPRHGPPAFGDYYRFLKDGLRELFDNIHVLNLDEWGSREAILYNVGIDDGHKSLGGRRFNKNVGSKNDHLYPWVTWIIFQKEANDI